MHKKIKFSKYHAQLNDFIVIDNREKILNPYKDSQYWEVLCHRRTGIGADGLLLLEDSKEADIKMRIINQDGQEVNMCGNGMMCLTMFAYHLVNQEKDSWEIETREGVYQSKVLKNGKTVQLEMTELYDFGKKDLSFFDFEKSYYLNTGVPHACFLLDDLEHIDVYSTGKKIQEHEVFRPGGVNVNFIKVIKNNHLEIRTVERGVFEETFACGTGAVASALSYCYFFDKKGDVLVKTRGGDLVVNYDGPKSPVCLKGKSYFVFSGEIIL